MHMKNTSFLTSTALTLAVGLGFGAAPAEAAVSMPFSDDFSDDTLNSEWGGDTDEYTLDTSTEKLDADVSYSGGDTETLAVEVESLPDTVTVSSDFEWSSLDGNASSRWGLKFLGSSNDPDTGWGFIGIQKQSAGHSFYFHGPGATTTTVSRDADGDLINAWQEDVLYNLEVEATITPDGVDNFDVEYLVTLTQGTNTDTATHNVEDVDVSSNTFFGYLVYDHGNNAADMTGELDNFQIVPEPASLALLGVGGLCLLGGRRRK